MCQRRHPNILVRLKPQVHDEPVSAHQQPGHFTVRRYLEMAECGIISDDDRVELLDGLIIAMAPPSPLHDSAVSCVQYALHRKLGLDVVVRVQSTFVVGRDSAPQPDIAVVPGSIDDYWDSHPTKAHLLVEVAVSSVLQDRLTKAAIYARAGVPCFWIVNLRDRCVEPMSEPDRFAARYRQIARATGSNPLAIDAYPHVSFEARELLPPAGVVLNP